MVKPWTWMALALLLGACAPAKGVPTASPPPGERAPDEYRVAPRDEIKILVVGHPDLTGAQRVSSEGTVYVPLVGEVVAAGRTKPELAGEIERRLADGYLKRPKVMVTVATYGESVYVVGEVARPGAYAFHPKLTVLQLLAVAGGETPRAALGRVRVVRPNRLGGMETVSVEPWDLLRPDDVLVVPERVF